MPTYTYKCESCGKKVEHFLWLSQRLNPPPCKCGGVNKQTIGDSPPGQLIIIPMVE